MKCLLLVVWACTYRYLVYYLMIIYYIVLWLVSLLVVTLQKRSSASSTCAKLWLVQIITWSSPDNIAQIATFEVFGIILQWGLMSTKNQSIMIYCGGERRGRIWELSCTSPSVSVHVFTQLLSSEPWSSGRERNWETRLKRRGQGLRHNWAVPYKSIMENGKRREKHTDRWLTWLPPPRRARWAVQYHSGWKSRTAGTHDE